MSAVLSSAAGEPNRSPVLLFDFFHDSFLPEFPAVDLRQERNRFRRAIRWLERAIGRPATTADFARSTILYFRHFMETWQDTNGMSLARTQQDRLFNAINRLWKFAHAIGISPIWNPPLRGNSKRLPPMRMVVPNVPKPTEAPPRKKAVASIPLSELLENRFLADGSQGANYATQFRASIRRFSEMLGRDATTTDLNRELVALYRSELAKSGLRPKTQAWHYQRLRRLWRYARDLDLVESFNPLYRQHKVIVKELPPAQPGTVRHFFETTYRPQKLLGAAAKSIARPRHTMRKLHDHYDRDILLSELTNDLASDHFAWLLDRDLTAASVNAERATLFAVWRYAHDLALVSNLPRVPKLPTETNVPVAWTFEQAQQIIKAAKSFRVGQWICGIAAPDYWYALLLVGYWTALRRRALFGIRWCDLDLESGRLRVPAANMKTRRGKTFILGADAIDALRAIQQPDRELVFPVDHTMESEAQSFKYIVAAANVPTSPRRSLTLFHQWRRTVATIVAKRGGLSKACELLDHSSEYVTRLYVDEAELPGRDATQILPPLSTAADQVSPAGDRIERAAVLYRSGEYEAAGGLARTALQKLLYAACIATGGVPAKEWSKSGLGRLLIKRGIIPATELELLRRLCRIGNRAAHGSRVDRRQIEELIEGVRDLAMRLPK